MTIIDNVNVDFKFTGCGRSPSGNADDDIVYNNFDLTVAYNGKKVKLPYSVGNIDLKGLKEKHLQGIFKMDLLARVIIDCYPFETIDELREAMIEKGYDCKANDFEETCKQTFEDIKAQAQKWRTLFTDDDIEQIKTELQAWFDQHPEHTIGKLEIKN